MTVQIVFVLRFKGIPPKLFGTNFFVFIQSEPTKSENKKTFKRRVKAKHNSKGLKVEEKIDRYFFCQCTVYFTTYN